MVEAIDNVSIELTPTPIRMQIHDLKVEYQLTDSPIWAV